MEQPSADRDVKAMLERYVVMIDGLNTSGCSIRLLSLRPEDLDILWLNFGQQLPAEEWDQVHLDAVGTTDKRTKRFHFLKRKIGPCPLLEEYRFRAFGRLLSEKNTGLDRRLHFLGVGERRAGSEEKTLEGRMS